MATLFNMYQDTPRTDISGQLTTLRREEKDRRDKNWQGSKDLLRGAAVDSIRKDYKNGISWDNGVKSADDSFKKQYDRMMVADPQAAAQLREDYQAERTRRLNAEVADRYEKGYSGAGGEIQALEQEIQALEAEIQADELQAQQAAQEEVDRKAAEEAQLLSNEQARKDSTAQMQGYTPEPQQPTGIPGTPGQENAGLRAFYGTYPEPVVYPLAPDRVPSATALDPTPEELPGPWAKGPGMPKKPSLQNFYGGMK